MVRFLQYDTHEIDAKSFKDLAIRQGWLADVVHSVISQLFCYRSPFVVDKKGKVYISNRYRFDVLDLDLDESFFDWYPVNDDLLN